MVDSDHIVLRRLLLAKSFYKRGVDLSRNAAPLDAMIALHHIHLSVEITLRALSIAIGLPFEQSKDPGFMDLIKQIDKKLKEQSRELPYKAQLFILNTHRNWVQHQAERVSVEFLDDAKVHAKDFLKEVFQDYFNKEFDNIDEIDYIADLNLREILGMAKALSQRDGLCGLASVCLEIAFKKALKSWSKKVYLFDDAPASISEECEELDYMEDILLLHVSGINLFEYQRYRQANPTVAFAEAGNYRVIHTVDEKTYSADIAFKISFVMAAIIKWQEMNLNPQVVNPDATMEQLRKEVKEALSA